MSDTLYHSQSHLSSTRKRVSDHEEQLILPSRRSLPCHQDFNPKFHGVPEGILLIH